MTDHDHPIDPYLSGIQRQRFSAADKDEILRTILTKHHEAPNLNPPPPVKPVEPVDENLDYVPYHPHTWGEKEWGDEYEYRVCAVCDEYDYYPFPEAHSYDCWKILAEERNRKRRRDHQKALDRYDAQVEYWKTLTDGSVAITEFNRSNTGIPI
jgi:hypothetical protein